LLRVLPSSGSNQRGKRRLNQGAGTLCEEPDARKKFSLRFPSHPASNEHLSSGWTASKEPLSKRWGEAPAEP
jgi:hypothetical protein